MGGITICVGPRRDDRTTAVEEAVGVEQAEIVAALRRIRAELAVAEAAARIAARIAVEVRAALG